MAVRYKIVYLRLNGLIGYLKNVLNSLNEASRHEMKAVVREILRNRFETARPQTEIIEQF